MVKTSFCCFFALFCKFYRGDIFSYSARCDVDPNVYVKAKKCGEICIYTAIASVIGGIIGYAIGFMQRTGWKTLCNNGDMLHIGQKPSVGLSNGVY